MTNIFLERLAKVQEEREQRRAKEEEDRRAREEAERQRIEEEARKAREALFFNGDELLDTTEVNNMAGLFRRIKVLIKYGCIIHVSHSMIL